MMKKLLMCVAAMFCLAGTVSAQTAEQKQASDERLEKLRTERPKECGVQEIDKLADKCKTMADATLGVAAVTETLTTGDTDALAQQVADLTARLQGVGNDLSDASKMLADATNTLKSIKNPMKVKSATKSLNYANEIIATVPLEIAYQRQLLAELAGGN